VKLTQSYLRKIIIEQLVEMQQTKSVESLDLESMANEVIDTLINKFELGSTWSIITSPLHGPRFYDVLNFHIKKILNMDKETFNKLNQNNQLMDAVIDEFLGRLGRSRQSALRGFLYDEYSG
jgi:hypothetical protein